MALLEVSALTIRYGVATALDRLDLQVAAGEIFVLLGGSGSGKTTLLRALGGFLPASAGRVTLEGRDITALPPYRRPVNTMFQSYALFPHMDVAENIGFGLRRQGMRGAMLASRVAELLLLVRLDGFGARRVSQLSGGQQQRVALARALAPRPRLLLLDEPLSALDRGLRAATRDDLVATLRKTGTTAILVTHDQEEALAIADRIGVLYEGKLVQVGAPAALYERPASRYVAGFLGAANIFPATVVEAGERMMLRLAGGMACAMGAVLAVGSDCHLAVRPERMRLVAEEAGGPNRLRATVRHAAYVGAALVVTLEAAGQTVQVTQALSDGLQCVPEPGSAWSLCWPEEAGIVLTA